MINDLQLLTCQNILFEKKCVIWGAGKNGKRLYSELQGLGIEEGKLFICDTNAEKIQKKWYNNVLNLQQMTEIVIREKDNFLIIISAEALSVQDEIIGKLKELDLFDMNIYTYFAAKCGILFACEKKHKILSQVEEMSRKNASKMLGIEYRQSKIEYFAMASYLDQMILVYQPKKVGSLTIWRSLKNYGIPSLHVHELRDLYYAKQVMEKNNGKIIAAVRNPLEWRISLFWHVLEEAVSLSSEYIDFFELQDKYFGETFARKEFEWFEEEMKEVMGIDVFAYPFDKEHGYTIIKKGNIELLLLVSEKINELQNVIGEFVGVSDFRLENTNVAGRKKYRFAYTEYKKKFKLSEDILESICNDECVKHFYTEEAIFSFKERWKSNMDYKGNGENQKVGIDIV